MSVLSCPRPNPFTHTQRLCVSLLLLLGYAAVNTAVTSQMEDEVGQTRPERCFLILVPIVLSSSQFDVGMIDVALSVKTGVVSALLVLPAGVLISFLFRMRDIKLTGSQTHHKNDCPEGEFQQRFSPERFRFFFVLLQSCIFFGEGAVLNEARHVFF